MPSLSSIPRVSVTSVFDILVVAFLVYEFLKLIKGTRAIAMLAAVVILALAFWIAHLEALKTVDWLITTLLPYAIFALIVVFGAEIRRALARLGQKLSAGRGGAFNGTDSYEDIVLAANHFSQTVTGALIVIERDVYKRQSSAIRKLLVACRPSGLACESEDAFVTCSKNLCPRRKSVVPCVPAASFLYSQCGLSRIHPERS